MSILIKNMAMPKSCLQCPFRKFWDDEDQCLAKKNLWVKGNEIPPVCPLIELPPHGDLIDRKELLADLEQSVVFSGRPSIGEIQLASSELRGANKIIDRIKVAPVVVESENGK